MIETGNELIDVIIKTITNNPIETIIFLFLVVFAYKFFNNEETRYELWWGFKHWLTIDVRFFVPRFINNKRYSYCGIEVEQIEKVFSIIKTRYAYSWRQREIIRDETRLSNDQIEQIINGLISQGRIIYDEKHRLIMPSMTRHI